MIAGVGFWGKSWVRVVRESTHWELVALVDTDEAALTRCAADEGIDRSACFGSVAAAAERVESDAVLIAVPPALHAQLAVEALDRGLHCLIEKPLAHTMHAARTIVGHAETTGHVVMVSQQYRYRPGARTVAQLVEECVVGRVGAVFAFFSHDLMVSGFRLEMDEPLLLDMAIHHFDLVRGALGLEPVRVQAISTNPSWSPYKGNAAATAVLETDDGVGVTYTGTFAPRGTRTGWDGVWEILCECGSIHWDGDDVTVKPLERPLLAKLRQRALRREWRGQRVKSAAIREADRLGVLAEFGASIREEREPETSGRDNLGSLALVVAAVESARRRVPVEIAELE